MNINVKNSLGINSYINHFRILWKEKGNNKTRK